MSEDPKGIIVINRITEEEEEEAVFGDFFLKATYGNFFFSLFFRIITARLSLFSFFYGLFQSTSYSKKFVKPFIKNFSVDSSEFKKKVDEFTSFNDFFIRKLKKNARPIDAEENSTIIPADGRYLFYENIQKDDDFIIKGKNFCLEKLLKSKKLACQYLNGNMVIARLCPTDYHRFHFPINCSPSDPKLINGPLFSVNPIATNRWPKIFSENKRMIISLNSSKNPVLFIEVGATNVGSIHNTFSNSNTYKRGDELGYFSFGASALIMLFQKKSISFSKDIQKYINSHKEIKCLIGQQLGLLIN